MSDLRPADSWLGHARATVWLGLPLIGAQLAQTALNVTNTLVLGRLGPDELAASVLGWQLFFVVWMFGSGFGFAVMPLVANALKNKDVIVTGIAGGVIGYTLGNYFGTTLAFFLQRF